MEDTEFAIVVTGKIPAVLLHHFVGIEKNNLNNAQYYIANDDELAAMRKHVMEYVQSKILDVAKNYTNIAPGISMEIAHQVIGTTPICVETGTNQQGQLVTGILDTDR